MFEAERELIYEAIVTLTTNPDAFDFALRIAKYHAGFVVPAKTPRELLIAPLPLQYG